MIRNYHKYDRKSIKGKYDVAIIGSGLGGLSAAVLLAKAGKRVIVLERHFRPGGFTHVFKRKKYEWDVGVHYVGQVNNDKSLMKRLFDIVTNNQLQWDDMGEIYDQAVIGGKVFNFRKGEGNFKGDLKARFPNDHQAIDDYFALVNEALKYGGMYLGERTMPPLMSKTFGYFLRRKYNVYCKKTTYDTLKELTNNEDLIAVLCTQCGNYGLPPKQSSLAMHLTIAGHYIDGASYPRGGASEIFKTMSKNIVDNGGEIYVNAAVESIQIKKGKVSALKMEDGSFVEAEKYISNAGLFNTFNHLLNDSPKIRNQKSKVNDIGSSTSHICLYAGFKESDEVIGFPKYNQWLYKSINASEDIGVFMNDPSTEYPLMYLSFPSAKNST